MIELSYFRNSNRILDSDGEGSEMLMIVANDLAFMFVVIMSMIGRVWWHNLMVWVVFVEMVVIIVGEDCFPGWLVIIVILVMTWKDGDGEVLEWIEMMISIVVMKIRHLVKGYFALIALVRGMLLMKFETCRREISILRVYLFSRVACCPFWENESICVRRLLLLLLLLQWLGLELIFLFRFGKCIVCY